MLHERFYPLLNATRTDIYITILIPQNILFKKLKLFNLDATTIYLTIYFMAIIIRGIRCKIQCSLQQFPLLVKRNYDKYELLRLHHIVRMLSSTRQSFGKD